MNTNRKRKHKNAPRARATAAVVLATSLTAATLVAAREPQGADGQVTLRSPNLPSSNGQSADKLAKNDGPVVTYSGFRAHDDGSSTIRVEVSQSVPVRAEQDGVTWRFLLEGARITIKNNKNPLLAKHFHTNVVSARLVPEEGGVVLELKLRKAVKSTHRVENHPGGSATVVVDVPGAR